MKKLKLKPIVSMPLLVFIFLNFISAMPTIWPNNVAITSEVKTTCTQFKILQGSNRIAEFNKIAQTILKKNQETINGFTLNDVEKMLGKPNSINQNEEWVYHLNPNQNNCVATFSYKENTHILFCKIINNKI